MLKKLSFLIITLLCTSTITANTTSQEDAEIVQQLKEAIIKKSISSYLGNCPCPYNKAKNGTKCGNRSAYKRAGGYAPICYPNDITKEMIYHYIYDNLY